MNTNWANNTLKYFKRVYFKNDKRVAAFLVCVAIASGFWYLNALSKTYTAELIVPVKYYNFPDNKIFSGNLPDKFKMTVRAHGFTIMRHKVSFLRGPLAFDVNEMTNGMMSENNKTHYAFPTRLFLSNISYQMSNELEIMSISPDTLHFGFGQLGQKRIKVKPTFRINLKKQYQVSGETRAIPSEILVNGPQTMLDTLRFIPTKLQIFNGIDKTIQEKAELEPITNLFFDRQWVNIEIPIEEYTEGQQLVQIDIPDAPSDTKVKLFPARVKVSFLVGLSRFSKIHPEDFRISVSYSDIEKGLLRLPLTLTSTPPFLYDVKIGTKEIEYLIEN